MDSSPTLQDFVLNLIYDPVARSAFELDPTGTLQEAGLGDVTAADVQDVLPLVLDYAPLAGVQSIDGLSQVDDLTTGVANLDVAGAAAHLQAITAHLGGPASQVTGDLNVAAAGAVTVTAGQLVDGVLHGGVGVDQDGLFGRAGLGVHGLGAHGLGVQGLGLDGLGLDGLGLDGHGGLSADHDPAAGLDGSVTAPVQDTVTNVTYSADGVLSHATTITAGTLDGTVNTVTGLTGSLDLDVSGVHGATSSVIGSVLGSEVGSLTGGLLPDGTGVGGTVDGSLHSTVDGTVGDVEHHVSGVIGGATGLVGGVTGAVSGDPHTTEPDAGHGLLGGLTGLDF
jgi:hypothetical protein